VTLVRRPAPREDYYKGFHFGLGLPSCSHAVSAAELLVLVDLNLFRCAFGPRSVPKTSRAGRPGGCADVIRHYAAATRCGSAADCGLRRRPQAEFSNGAVISEREPEDAIELSRASRQHEDEWARDLAFEPATELESIELRETQIEHDEIDPL
jgi:hypothetical protein